MLDFWRTSTTRRKRVLSILAFLILSIAVTIAGLLTPLSNEEAQSLGKQLQQMQQDAKNMTVLDNTRTLFENNFLICLVTFVPFIGPFFGLYVLYNTGLILGAESAIYGVPALPTFMLYFILPFFWLEYFANSIALSESVWLTRRIVQRRALKELRSTGILIGICAGMLFAGAIIEAVLISLVV